MMPECLCWNCNAPQAFYAPRCEHCGATNPNVDFERANAEALDESLIAAKVPA